MAGKHPIYCSYRHKKVEPLSKEIVKLTLTSINIALMNNQLYIIQINILNKLILIHFKYYNIALLPKK